MNLCHFILQKKLRRNEDENSRKLKTASFNPKFTGSYENKCGLLSIHPGSRERSFHSETVPYSHLSEHHHPTGRLLASPHRKLRAVEGKSKVQESK